MLKKKLPWMALFLVIAGATVWAVVSQSRSFSLYALIRDLREASLLWLLPAFCGMAGFILFEGFALRSLIYGLSGQRRCRSGVLYSAADIYFSAITPSATGGQPASAFFMVADGVPVGVATVILLVNLILYTLALLVTGLFALALRPKLLLSIEPVSRVLICIGFLLLIVLAGLFYLMLRKESLIRKLANALLSFGEILHLVHQKETLLAKLDAHLAQYRACAALAAGKKKVLIRAFGWNLLQRISQTSVIVFVYLALQGLPKNAADVWCVQVLSAIGSNCIPIPGAMGIADYLLIQGLEEVPRLVREANMELISRSVSFYFCVLICLVITMIGYIRRERHTAHSGK